MSTLYLNHHLPPWGLTSGLSPNSKFNFHFRADLQPHLAPPKTKSTP